jgi:hypothetical protein
MNVVNESKREYRGREGERKSERPSFDSSFSSFQAIRECLEGFVSELKRQQLPLSLGLFLSFFLSHSQIRLIIFL